MYLFSNIIKFSILFHTCLFARLIWLDITQDEITLHTTLHYSTLRWTYVRAQIANRFFILLFVVRPSARVQRDPNLLWLFLSWCLLEISRCACVAYAYASACKLCLCLCLCHSTRWLDLFSSPVLFFFLPLSFIISTSNNFYCILLVLYDRTSTSTLNYEY